MTQLAARPAQKPAGQPCDVGEIKMRKIFFGILCAVVLLLAFCNLERTKARNYKGEGEIEFLPGPPLGTSGWRVKLPPFDMSKGIDKKYKLTGLPKGKEYSVFLVVPTELPQEALNGTFSFRVSYNGKTLQEAPSKQISQMIKSSNGLNDNNFYFFDQQPTKIYWFSVPADSLPLELDITCQNTSLKQPLQAFVKVERGGFK